VVGTSGLKSLVGDTITEYGQQECFTCALTFGLTDHVPLPGTYAGPTNPAENKVPVSILIGVSMILSPDDRGLLDYRRVSLSFHTYIRYLWIFQNIT
jgi:hypothetical protein